MLFFLESKTVHVTNGYDKTACIASLMRWKHILHLWKPCQTNEQDQGRTRIMSLLHRAKRHSGRERRRTAVFAGYVVCQEIQSGMTSRKLKSCYWLLSLGLIDEEKTLFPCNLFCIQNRPSQGDSLSSFIIADPFIFLLFSHLCCGYVGQRNAANLQNSVYPKRRPTHRFLPCQLRLQYHVVLPDQLSSSDLGVSLPVRSRESDEWINHSFYFGFLQTINMVK